MEIVKGMEEKNEKTNENVSLKNEVSVEQLKNWVDQLLAQRNLLAERLNQVSNILNKLPWLFKVVELKDSFNSEFVDSCVEEITYILSTPENESENSTEGNKEVKD